jgi:serine/threonine protein kinase
LSRRFTQRKEIVEKFLADARQIAALDHRNLVHVFDIGSDDDQYFIVMEYVVGKDLRRLVAENGPLPFPIAADYLAQAAEGLGHAHALGVIHGDLRPEDLMLDNKGVIKILGLGVGPLASVSDATTSNQATRASRIHADYRSPQQRRGETPGDMMSDVFSLGAVAHYLLTGLPPRHVSGQDDSLQHGPVDTEAVHVNVVGRTRLASTDAQGIGAAGCRASADSHAADSRRAERGRTPIGAGGEIACRRCRGPGCRRVLVGIPPCARHRCPGMFGGTAWVRILLVAPDSGRGGYDCQHLRGTAAQCDSSQTICPS